MRAFEIGPITQRPTPDDVARATRLAKRVMDARPVDELRAEFGLSVTLADSALDAASLFLHSREPYWVFHLLLCQVLAQGRTKDMTTEHIAARREIERVCFAIIYGEGI